MNAVWNTCTVQYSTVVFRVFTSKWKQHACSTILKCVAARVWYYFRDSPAPCSLITNIGRSLMLAGRLFRKPWMSWGRLSACPLYPRCMAINTAQNTLSIIPRTTIKKGVENVSPRHGTEYDMGYTGVRHTSPQKGVMRYVMRCVIRWHWRRVSTCNRITLASLQHDVIHAGGVGDDSLKCGGTSREEEGGGGRRHEAKSSKVA